MDAFKWKTLGKLLVSLIATGVLVAGIAMPIVLGSGVLARNEAAKFLDTSCNLKESAPPQKTYMYAKDGKTLIATLFSQDRQLVPLTEIPKYLQQALVATEDRRFYSHNGVDIRGLMRSAVSTGSGDTQGGSTLTMQYVKQIRYFQAGDNLKEQRAAVAQNLQRKMEDAKCALYFEGTKHEKKSEIIDNYLNIAFFGEHAYGIQTAAETYFGKPVRELTLAESALLVGLLRAPSDYDPYVNPVASKNRRDQVLQNLVEVGKLSQRVANQQKAAPIVLATKGAPLVREGCQSAKTTIKNVAFFCEYAKNWIESNNGLSEHELNTGGYKIVTTLDPSIQDSAQTKVAAAVPAKAPTTAVLPVLDPKTGNVLAMAASKSLGNKKGQTYQQIFTKATASGASTFKLFPLLTALQTGIPSGFQLKTVGNKGGYKIKKCQTTSTVRNGDANVLYNTVEDLSNAWAKSDNSYFVALTEQLNGCQLDPMVALAQKLGMNGLNLPSDIKGKTWAQTVVAYQRAQQFALGSIPTSPLQLAGAYAAVANGGVYNAPSPILSIKDSDGQNVPIKRTVGTQVISPQVAAQAVQIMLGDTEKGGTSAGSFSKYWYKSNPSKIGGKTGTAEASGPKKYEGKNASIWFVGITPNLVSTVALINFDQPNAPSAGLPGVKDGAAYGSYASDIWIKALAPTLKSTSWTWPDPAIIPGTTVPNVQGKAESDARAQLKAAGFKMTVLGGESNSSCPSSEPLESVGYYGPQRALPGSTITVCLSSGVAPYSAPPPVYNPPTTVYNPPTGRQKPTTKPKPGQGNNGRSSGSGGSRSGSGSGGGSSGSGGSGGGTGGGTGSGGRPVIGPVLPVGGGPPR